MQIAIGNTPGDNPFRSRKKEGTGHGRALSYRTRSGFDPCFVAFPLSLSLSLYVTTSTTFTPARGNILL